MRKWVGGVGGGFIYIAAWDVVKYGLCWVL